ncbi:hypothetical protein M3Y99_00970700 [Aphelenchoides fujianensis]|nr:hypothetical protein M3Y99_00970700 [Aphelenchoides fujianensis]
MHSKPVEMWSSVKEFVRNRKRFYQRNGKLAPEMNVETKTRDVDDVVTAAVDLEGDICGSGITNRKLLELLVAECGKFERTRGSARVDQITYDNCGKGNGYLSLVIKVHLQFEDPAKTPFSVVLKVPMPDAMKGMIDNGSQNGHKKDEPEIDENARTIIDGHNRECQFYERFARGQLGDWPLPEVYYTQQFPEGPTLDGKKGLILMENLSDRCEILGIARAVNPAQIFSMARLLAHLQFRVHQVEEHRSWWMSLESNLHLDAFYSSWMPAGLPAAANFEGIGPMMRKLKTGFEMFELAFAHQTTYLTSFLFFFSEMAKQSETVRANLKQMGERARYCVQQTMGIIDKYNLERFANAQ